MLGRPAKDRDFVALTNLSFAEFTSAVETIGKVFQAREEFLTLRCLIEGEPIDIAFPRAEFGFSDARHPDAVERVSTLEEDASRRDFTINAMFMREDGEIIDFFGGRQDLKNRMIRTVGSPKERFNEDALRILRAIRFACKLNFEIDFITALHMEVQAPLIRKVSIERIQIELSQALQANPLKAFQEIANLAIFSDLAEMGLTFEATLKKRK